MKKQFLKEVMTMVLLIALFVGVLIIADGVRQGRPQETTTNSPRP